MNNTGRIIIGVAAGAAVGALLGVLFAPAKGSETRNRITRKGEEYLDAASEKIENVKGKANEFVEKTRRKAENIRKGMNTTMN